MTQRNGITRFAALLASALLISACGGGSSGGDGGGGGGGDGTDSSVTYDGATKAASIDDSQKAEDMSRASSEGARQTKTQDEAPTLTAVAIEDSNLRDQLDTITRELIEQVESNQAVSGATLTVQDECSGSSGTADFQVDNTTSDGFESGTITYNDYCTGTTSDGTTLNGPVNFNYDYEADGDLSKASFNYDGVEVKDNATGATTTINVNTTCYYTNGNPDYCEFSEAFVGTNGVTYKVGNAQLSGSSGSYNLTAKVYHPAYGFVNVTTNTALAYNCSSGFPSSGEVTFSDGNGNSVTVTFDSCSQFSWTYNSSTGGTTSGTVTY